MRRSAPCRWAHFAFYRRFFKEIFAFVRRLKKSSVLSREKGRYYRLSAESLLIKSQVFFEENFKKSI